jgi:hypothetical protein
MTVEKEIVWWKSSREVRGTKSGASEFYWRRHGFWINNFLSRRTMNLY